MTALNVGGWAAGATAWECPSGEVFVPALYEGNKVVCRTERVTLPDGLFAPDGNPWVDIATECSVVPEKMGECVAVEGTSGDLAPGKSTSSRNQYQTTVGELRWLVLDWTIRRSFTADAFEFLLRSGAREESFRFKRVALTEAEALLENKLPTTGVEVRDWVEAEFATWAAIDGAFIFEFDYTPDFEPPLRWIGVVRSPSLEALEDGSQSCESGITLISAPFPSWDLWEDEGCNDQGCGCHAPPPICCTFSDGTLPGPGCGCAHASGCACDQVCGGACAPCGDDDDFVQAILADPRAQDRFFTDPLRATAWLADSRSISDVPVGGEL